MGTSVGTVPLQRQKVTPEQLHDAEQLGGELMRFLRLLERAHDHFSSQHKHAGLEKASYVLLAKLIDNGAQRMTALAEAVHSEMSTVSRQIGTLVKAGLVERKADQQDGRACVLAVTEHGRELFERSRKERTEQLAGMLTHWPAQKRQQLIALFGELNTEFESYLPQLIKQQHI